jgi:hypothetical protein
LVPTPQLVSTWPLRLLSGACSASFQSPHIGAQLLISKNKNKNSATTKD